MASRSNEIKARKIVTSSLHRFRLYVAFSFMFALIIQLVGLIPPLLMRNVIDNHIPNSDLSSAITSVVFFVSIPIVSTFLSTFYNYIITVAARNTGRTLTMLGFERLIYQPISYFDANNSAEVASYCKTEAMSYAVFWIFDIPRLAASILSGIIVYILIFVESPYIALGLLLYIPISILPSKKFAKMMGKYVKKIVDNNAKTNQLMTSAFKGIKFVKSMMLERAQLSKVKAINDDTVTVWSKTAAIEKLNANWTDNFVDNLFTGIVFSVSAIMVINGMATLGMLILLLNYSPLFFASIKAIAGANFQFASQLAQFDRFFEILAMDDESKHSNEGVEFSLKNSIRFNDVSFAYNEERGRILKGLNIELEKGKWIGIVGASGAGKTTIFDLMLRFYDNFEGSIYVDDTKIIDLSLRSLREGITKVSQDLFLFPGTLKENFLLIKPDATDEDLYEVIEDVGLGDFIKKLPDGFDTHVGEDGLLISGGEKQRICLAMGLLRGSKVLLLDEVTASVDLASEELIKKSIKKLMQSHDLTVVAISHRLNFLEDADYILSLEDGALKPTT